MSACDHLQEELELLQSIFRDEITVKTQTKMSIRYCVETRATNRLTVIIAVDIDKKSYPTKLPGILLSFESNPSLKNDTKCKISKHVINQTKEWFDQLLDMENGYLYEMIDQIKQYISDYLNCETNGVTTSIGIDSNAPKTKALKLKTDERKQSDNDQKQDTIGISINSNYCRYVLSYDHMRDKSNYIKTLKKWCHQVNISGILVFIPDDYIYKVSKVVNNCKSKKRKHGNRKNKTETKQNDKTSRMLIFHIIEGQLSDCQTFLQWSKTRYIDIDSKGKKCKERMMKILDSKQNMTSKQMFFEKWKCIQIQSPIANSNQLLSLLLSTHCDMIDNKSCQIVVDEPKSQLLSVIESILM